MRLIIYTFLSVLSVSALRLQAVGRRSPRGSLTALKRRGNVQGDSLLTDNADISYTTSLQLNNQPFDVLIDTGSADLWVAGSVQNAVDSGATSGVSYAVGQVEGPIKFATLDFAGIQVSSQAYLEVTPDSTNAQGTGLIGLGPSNGSNIFVTLGNDPKAAGPLDRMFATDTTTPNILTVFLGRQDDPLDILSGDITVAEVISNMSSITSQPQLPVQVRPVSDAGDQHFAILVDQDGIIGPDGNPITITSKVSGSNPNQATAILDTGFSLPQVPKSVSDAIYSRVSGAEYVNNSQIGAPVWIVPCTQEVNLTFKIAGVKYPIHPLDVTLEPSLLGVGDLKNSQGQKCCIGMYQPISFDTDILDMVLGMAFIRNTYALFNYGDFVAGATTNRAAPYVQLLPTTDPARAHADFVQVRLNGVDTTGSQTLGAATSSSDNSGSSSGFHPPTTWLIIGGVALGVALLIILVVAIIICQRRRRNTRNAAWGTYRPLDGQFSQPINGQMHNPAPAYNPQQGQVVYDTQTYEKWGNYQNPFDHRM